LQPGTDSANSSAAKKHGQTIPTAGLTASASIDKDFDFYYHITKSNH
jgi:hypothetical protein